MRVKIIQSSLGSYWYSDLIGKEFDVIEEVHNDVLVKTPDGNRGYIDFGDYEVLQDDAHNRPLTSTELGYLDGIVNPRKDPINPDYYKGKVECIEAITEATKDLQGIEAVDTAQVIKYIWRWKKKNGIEDLRKLKFYLEHLINYVEKEQK